MWWEYYRLSELSADELLDERAGVSGLVLVGTVGGTQTAPIDRYRFPPQDTDLHGGEELRRVGGEKFGMVESISLEDWTVDIKKRKDTANVHPCPASALVRQNRWLEERRISGSS